MGVTPLPADSSFDLAQAAAAARPQVSAVGTADGAALLAAAFDASRIGLAHIDPATRCLLDANPAFCRLCGYELSELRGLDFGRQHPPEDPLDEALFDTLLDGRGGCDLEKRLLRKDGTVVWAALSGSVACDAQGMPLRVLCIARDVTERLQAQAALREREERLAFLVRLNDRLRRLDDPTQITPEVARLLFEFAGVDGLAYAEDGGDGRTVSVTRHSAAGRSGTEARYRYKDYGPELLQALRAGRTVQRPDIARDPALSPAERAAHAELQLGATVSVPLLKAGRLHATLVVHSRVARAWTPGEVALFEDVAERLRADLERARAEAALRSARSWLATALASMNDAVFITDTQGRFLEFNEAFAAFHRFPGKLRGPQSVGAWRRRVEIAWPDGRPVPPRLGPAGRALRGESGSNVEYLLRSRDTGERWHGLYSFAPIRDSAGRIVGAVVTARDIGELKRLHAELETAHVELQRLVAAQDQAREQERLRIARELHDDLQQTLAAVLLEVGTARGADAAAAAPVHEAIGHIEALARHALTSTRRIIRDLRPQALEELGLVAALESLAAQFSGAGGPACTVDVQGLGPVDEPRLATLATPLYRVTQEALTNVVKHAAARTVCIVLARSSRGALKLAVSDDGVGLPEGRTPHSDAFGLAGIRERVRAVGGTLRLRSRAGGGTTVEVEIPAAAPYGQKTP